MDDLRTLKILREQGNVNRDEAAALDRVIKLLEFLNKTYGGMFPQ